MRSDQPDEWKQLAEVSRDDGAIVRLSERIALDYWEQLKTNYNKYEVYKNGKLIELHEDTIQVRWFYEFEFELMLQAAEFKDIAFTYVQADRAYMMVSARK
ncbi:hypothetical protein [Paenibacillus agricola]|nr:hypothetical protein [Paenibacillus agricola]